MSIIAAGMISLMTLTAGLPDVMWLGEPTGSQSAVSHAMGGSGFTHVSPLGVLENPSLMGLAGDGLLVEFSAGADLLVEKRTRRVYDSFESSIGESEIAFNKEIGFFPAGAAVVLRGQEWLPSSLSLAAGYRVPSTFDYGYGRIVRDASYVKTGEEMLDISGRMNEFDMAVAFSPSEALTFGFAGGYLTGSRDVEWDVSWVDPSQEGTVAMRKESMSCVVTRGSLLFVPYRRVFITAGVDYPLSLSVSPENSGDPVDWNTLSDQDYDLDMPMTVRLGAIYMPGNLLRSRVTGEFNWSSEGSLEFQDISLGLDNSWGVTFGVENSLPGGPTARFGFSYRRSPIAAALDRMTFSTGLGFSAGDWNLDVSGSFSPDRWAQTQVSGLPSFVTGDSLTVEETETRLMFSVSRAFGL
ncbi:MAG: hypothetical protein AVO35_00640 [Candidatus Aegiribacteria sp. MLS_C]|nr:MAG: hypothetical protein AVO35_00640 [Candidatus Aegiribacteria sp. MLS_C]